LSVGLAQFGFLLSLVSLGIWDVLDLWERAVDFSSDNYCKQTFAVKPTFIVMKKSLIHTIHKNTDYLLFLSNSSQLPNSSQSFIESPTKDQTMEPTSDATDLKSGPFSVLYKAVKGNTQVLINVRNNHKLLGRVKAYDRHMNL
jgi:hypothetical protein